MKAINRVIASLLCVFVITAQIWALPQFTREEGEGEQETENAEESDTEEEEDIDDVYDEEQASTAAAVDEPEEEDKDDLEDRLAREKIANRLGIQNFSSAAIAEKASNLLVAYLATRNPPLPIPPRPRKKAKPPGSDPVAITTKKYKIIKTTPIPLKMHSKFELLNSTAIHPNTTINMTSSSNQIRTFVITVPHGMNGTGGGTIEINIPMPMMTAPEMIQNGSLNMSDPHSSQMAISSPDEQGVKNIEAAIMEALLIAQQMTSMSMSASVSGKENNTEVLELDIGAVNQKAPAESQGEGIVTTLHGDLTNVTDSSVNSTVTVTPPSTQAEVAPPPIPEFPPPVNPKRKRPARVTSTIRPADPGDRFGVGPVTDIIVSQIRSGQLPQFLWRSIMKLSKSRYAQIAVDAVECAVFYYCPDDTELGTLSKGGAF